MKAGRELNVRVAEDVMEWHIGGWRDREWVDADGEEMYSIDHDYDGVRGFDPSESIEAAWLVVEKMKDSGYCVELFYDMVAWSVSFMHIDRDEKHGADWRNSIETQICLAALKAVE